MNTLFEITVKPKIRVKQAIREPNGRFCRKGMAEALFWKLMYEKRERYVKYLESINEGLLTQLKEK